MRTQTIEFGVYVLALGFAGLFGWQVWRARNPDWYKGPVTKDQWDKERERIETAGRSGESDSDAQWNFGASWLDWWRKVETANLVGKPEPVAPPPGGDTEVQKPPEPKTYRPVGEIVELKLIVAGEEEARIKVQYKDPNARDPESAAPTTPLTGVVAAGPTVAVTGSGSAFQDMKAGDKLWPPHDDWTFERIDFEVTAAVFRRPNPEGNGEDLHEKLALAEVGVDDQHFDKGLIDAIKAKATTRATTSTSHISWTDPGGETKMLQPNVWMVSQRDNDIIERDYERIMSEDLILDDYDSPRFKGKDGKPVRGVSVRSVSQSLARFGIASGDVLIKINGESVTSRANAIKVGKEQYQRGSRTFDLTFITRTGGEVVRSYRAPDKK